MIFFFLFCFIIIISCYLSFCIVKTCPQANGMEIFGLVFTEYSSLKKVISTGLEEDWKISSAHGFFLCGSIPA